MNSLAVLPRWWWTKWTLAITLGWSIGIFLLWLWNRNEIALILYVTVPFIAVAIGQGVILRGRVSRPVLWIVVTSIGYLVCSYSFLFIVVLTAMGLFCDMMGVLCNIVSDIEIFYCLFGLVTGLIPAIGQFLILKKLSKASWWIPTVNISYALFAAVLIITWGNQIFYSFNDMTIGNTILFIVLLPGLVLGVPTGVILQYLLNQSFIQPKNTVG